VNAPATDGHAYGPDRASVSTLKPQRWNRSGPGIVSRDGGSVAGGIKKSSRRQPLSVSSWTANLPCRFDFDSPARSSLAKCRETTDRSTPVKSARSEIEAVRDTRSTAAKLSRFGSPSAAAILAVEAACLRVGTAFSAACRRLLWMAELCSVCTVPRYRPFACTSVHPMAGLDL
jgi:hypothetical protein